MGKRNAEEVLRDIEASDADDAVEKALAMTPEQRRKQLEAAGVDVNELHAKADAWQERMLRAGNGAGHAEMGGVTRDAAPAQRAERRGRLVLLAAAVAIAAIVLALLLFPRLTKQEPPSATPPAPAPPTSAAPAPSPTQTAPAAPAKPAAPLKPTVR